MKKVINKLLLVDSCDGDGFLNRISTRIYEFQKYGYQCEIHMSNSQGGYYALIEVYTMEE